MRINGLPYRPYTTTFSTKLKENKKQLRNASQLSVEDYVQAIASYYKPPSHGGDIYSAPRTTRQPQFLEDLLAKKPTKLSHVPPELQIRCSTWILSSSMTTEEANCLGRVIAPILPVFTKAKAIETIAEAISGGKFGSPMEQAVAVAFAQNLHLFSSVGGQRAMSISIKNSLFGDPMDEELSQAIAQKLTVFTDPQAKENIIDAIIGGKFGKPTSTALQAFINETLNGLIWSNTPNTLKLLSFLDHVPSELQIRCSTWIKNLIQTEEEAKKIGSVIVSILSVFTEVEALENIATSLDWGNFGNLVEKDVALAFAQNLHLFSSVEAQRAMSASIKSNRFGNPLDKQVSREIAQNLTVFTDPKAKENTIDAIVGGKFGTPIPTATQPLLIEALNDMFLTIAPNKLKMLTSVLNLTSEFKLNTFACMRLPISAEYETLTSDLEIIQLIHSFSHVFPLSKPRGPSARVYLNQAIPLCNQYTYISNSSRLETIETKYPGVRMLLQDAAQWVAQIDTLKLAVTHGVYEEQHQIMAALRHFNYQDYEHITGVELFLTDITNELNRLQSKLNSELRTTFSMENIRLPLGSTLVTMNSKALEYLSAETGIDISDCFGHRAVTYQFYGYQDNSPTRPKLLLVYECETAKDKADFSGWLSDTDYMLYKDVVEKVKIYDLTGQEPMLLDIRDKEHESFNDLPLFMKSGVLGNLFNVDAYRFKEDLNCILGDNGIIAQLRSEHSENEDNLGVIAKMKCIIQACIVKQGDKVAIFPDSTQNNHYKNKLNELLYSRGNMNDYINLVSTFLETREESSAARLAFLFGQIAKTGVLGYEFNGINQANGFFYTLSKECFKRLTRQTISDVQKVSLLSQLNEGVCIEQVTHSFHVSYPSCGQVWQTTL